MIRSKDVICLPAFVNMLKEQLKNNSDISEWVLELVSVKEIIKEILMECPVNEKRRIIAGIIHAAVKAVAPQVQENFIKRMLNRVHMAKKPLSKNYSQFFEVIFRLVKLNSELVYQTQLMSRLISHLLDDKHQYAEYQESYNYSDIYLGYDKYHITDDESRTDRNYIGIGSSFAFLLATLQLGTRSLSPSDIDKLLEKNVMIKLAIEGSNKIGARAVGQLYATLCIHNQQASIQFINILGTFIREYDFDGFKPFFRQLTWMLKLQDNLQNDRVDLALKSFNEIMKENKNYYRATETCIDYLFKIITRITPVKEWILRKMKDIKWIDTWLKDNQYPMAGRTNITLYKPRSQNWNNSGYQPKGNLDRIEFMKKIAKGSIPDRSLDWDSDFEVDEEALQEGNKIDAIDSAGRWSRATIMQSIGELVFLKLDRKSVV